MNEAEISVAMYICNKDMDIIYDDKNNDQANICRSYGVNIGQCTEALHVKLEAEDRYEEITSSRYFIELLKLIKNES